MVTSREGTPGTALPGCKGSHAPSLLALQLPLPLALQGGGQRVMTNLNIPVPGPRPWCFGGPWALGQLLRVGVGGAAPH